MFKIFAVTMALTVGASVMAGENPSGHFAVCSCALQVGKVEDMTPELCGELQAQSLNKNSASGDHGPGTSALPLPNGAGMPNSGMPPR